MYIQQTQLEAMVAVDALNNPQWYLCFELPSKVLSSLVGA